MFTKFVFLAILSIVFIACSGESDKKNEDSSKDSDTTNINDSDKNDAEPVSDEADEDKDLEKPESEAEDTETNTDVESEKNDDTEQPFDYDSTVINDDDSPRVCGNGKLEAYELCELKDTIDCTLIGEYSSGIATCNSKCDAWDSSTCMPLIKNFPVLCTGIDKCYNNTAAITCPLSDADFYGQDAQYKNLCTAKSFTVADETVKDEVTGLLWQRIIPDKYPNCAKEIVCTWNEAETYCNSLVLGGYPDWRLPTTEELETIVDYGKYNPAVDIALFPNNYVNYPYFSSYSSLSLGFNMSFGVDFVSGKNLPILNALANVRCVRGNIWSVKDDFSFETIKGEVVVNYPKSKLQWTKNVAAKKTWYDALNYCEKLEYGGEKDWRLPNINEVSSIFYRKNVDNPQPESFVPMVTMNEFLASSSTVTDSPSKTWIYDLSPNGFGRTAEAEKSGLFSVVCVR